MLPSHHMLPFLMLCDKNTFQELGGEKKRISGAKSIFRVVKILCMMYCNGETCHYVFVQNHKCIPPRVNPNVDYGLWVMMTCQCRFINYNKSCKSGGEY